MPATAASPQSPTVDQPKHPLHALTTYELAYYRRRLENAIAYLGMQDPVPAIRAHLAAIDAELAGRAAARPGLPGSPRAQLPDGGHAG